MIYPNTNCAGSEAEIITLVAGPTQGTSSCNWADYNNANRTYVKYVATMSGGTLDSVCTIVLLSPV